jgi:prepilin-type N-terminal cleavage/methylation domain-containing protein
MLRSAVIPPCNGTDFLREAIERVQEVPYEREIMVVDEGPGSHLTCPIKKVIIGRRAPGGFTLLEVIMVIMVIGILAATFAYRYPYPVRSDVPLGIAADQLIADIRYVQERAMGTGKPHTISRDPYDFNRYIISEGEGLSRKDLESKKLPDYVRLAHTTLPTYSLTFNTLGEPTRLDVSVDYRTITLVESLTGATKTLRVYPITGKIEEVE